MENSFENKIYANSNGSKAKVPTLKYLVSQSIGEHTTLHSNKHNQNSKHYYTKSNSDSGNASSDVDDASQLYVGSSNGVQEEGEEQTEGSGDISNHGVSKYIRRSSELDVSHLLSTAYEKGAEWIQAGANLAYHMFSDETASVVPKARKKLMFAEDPGIASQRVEPSEFREPVYLKPARRTSVIHEQRSAQTSAIEQGTDDTAYYNGYCARVRGQGVILDTIFVNGSGPSHKSLEIRIRLQLPPPQPGMYGHLVREYCGKDDKTLHLKYTHGPVEGTVDVLCPPEVDPHKLLSVVRDSYLLITAP